jgi:hypothetical protein
VVNRARGGVRASPWVESLVWPQGNKGFAYMYTSIVTLENEAPLWQPCGSCDKPLCMNEERNCFYEFPTS